MARNISRVVLLCGLLVLAAGAGGCQREPTWNLAPVEGTVTKDGRPLANIQVVFLADVDAGTQGPRTRGITDEAGHYRLRTDNGDDGAVPGKHRVVLLDPEARKGRMGRAPQEPQPKEAEKAKDAPRLPPRYGNFSETPLRVEVRPEPQVIDLDVK